MRGGRSHKVGLWNAPATGATAAQPLGYANYESAMRWRAPLHLPLGFAVRKEDGAGTNRLWPIVCEFPEFAYAVVLRGRPGLRFTGTAGAAATTLPLALRLVSDVLRPLAVRRWS